MRTISNGPCSGFFPELFSDLSYSYLSNKRMVANKRRVWKKYLNLINEGSGTNGEFLQRYIKELLKIVTLFDFHPIFQLFFQK